jgi:hypothetical protein
MAASLGRGSVGRIEGSGVGSHGVE